MLRILTATLTLVLVAGCGAGTDETPAAGVEPGTVPSQVDGNVVQLPVTVRGMQLAKADGDVSGRTGHLHVFVDRDPVAEGATIPKEPGIVHAAEAPVVITGLKQGKHSFAVALGDGAHRRIRGSGTATVDVTVMGPTVQASAPATVAPGQPFPVTITSEGIAIAKADGDTSGTSGHYHVLVDPATPPAPGATIGPAEPGRIVHSVEPSVTLPGLDAGEHTIWVVIGDGSHAVLRRLAAAKLTVTVA